MSKRSCTIAECESNVHGHGLCYKHYMRERTHGDPLYVREVITVCRVDGCTRAPRSQSVDLCEAHYCRIRRHGDPLMVIDTRRPDAKYRAAHARIERDRGKASSFACVDCGVRAHHWAYERTDANALTSKTGQPYSLDPSYYAPRCRSCHAIFDGTGANQYSS